MRMTSHLVTLVGVILLFGLRAAAQENGGAVVSESGESVRLRQIYVPAEDPTKWPEGDWIPVAREEFLKLLGREVQEDPSSAYLERAVYRARLSRASLVGGTLEAVTRLRSDHSEFIDLNAPSLAVSRLHWSGREAVWGLADDGRTLLRVDEDGALLSGRWSLSGRKVFASTQFEVRVPPATVTQLELELPESRNLTIDRGLIARVTASQRPGWKVWHVDLGGRTTCHVSVSPASGNPSSATRDLQIAQASTYSFADSDLKIQTDITIQSASGEFRTIELVAPPAMTFSSVTEGNDRILPAWRKQQDQRSLLVIDVTGITLSEGTRLRVRGQMPLRPGIRQGLPRLGLLGAQWLQLRRQVRVVSPLQLKDIESSESRLVNASMGPDSGAALEFDDLGTNAQIRVTVDTPQPEMSADVLSRVDWQQTDPQLRTDLTIESQTGSAYSLVCDVPADWEVTRVDAGSALPVAQWQTIWDAASESHQLVVELRSALSPQSPLQISVLARPRSAHLGESLEVPVVMPLVAGDRSVAVVMTPPAGKHFEVPADSEYQVIGLADLVAERPELGEEFTNIGNAHLLVLQGTTPGDQQFLSVHKADEGATQRSLPEVGESMSAGNAATAEDTSVLARPIHAAMDVSTVVATDRGRLCRNRVVLHLPSGAGPQTLRLQLPDTVRLLSAESTLPVSSTKRDVLVEVPAAGQSADVTLSYECLLEQSLLSGEARIPLPQWNGKPTIISWQIEMPQRLRLHDATVGHTAVATPALTWSQRILGPLGRPPGGSLFWPLSVSAWQKLLYGEGQSGATTTSYQQLNRSLTGRHDTLRLVFWDSSLARRIGWVVLLVSLLITSWPFQQDRLLRRSWTLKLVLIGAAAALLSPEMLAIPWGGFVVGASIGALLPDQWRILRRRAVVREASTPATRTLLPLSATMGVLLASCLIAPDPCRGWQSSTGLAAADRASSPSIDRVAPLDVLVPLNVERPEQDDMPGHVYVDRAAAQQRLARRLTSPPRYLLRSADYQVDDFEVARPTINAHFDVVLLEPNTETRVVLKLTGLQFPDAQLCRVDGIPAPVLPHRSGDGVVVVVPASTVAEDGQESSVQVELVCQPRPAVDDQRPRLALGIPRVVSSRLMVNSPDPSPTIHSVHNGFSVYQQKNQRWRIELGGQGHLLVHPAQDVAAVRWATPVSASSVVEVHPMRLRVDSRLTFRTDRQWAGLEGRTLMLQLPRGSVVRDVRAEGPLQTHTAPSGRKPVQLNLLLPEDVGTELNIEISFDLPCSRTSQDSVVVIPPLPFLASNDVAGFPVHRLGVSAAPSFRLSTGDPEGMLPGTTGIDESQLPAWRGIRTSRSAGATFQLSSPRPLSIPLTPVTPLVGTSVRQTLTVRASTVEWSATLQMAIRDAPLALHRLQIDPRVNVRHVSVTQETVERLASWSRTAPDKLLLFLKEELSGSQTVQLKGTLAVEDRHDFVIPSLSVDEAFLTEPPEVVVQYAAGNPVVVAADDGTVVASEFEATATENIVQLPTLNHDPTLPPLSVQRGQHKAGLDVEQMTILESVHQGAASWTRLVRIDTSRMSRESLNVEVSAVPPHIQFAASVPMSEEVRGETTLLTLDLAAAPSSEVDVTLTGESPLPSGLLPEVRIDATTPPQHLVVILDGTEVAVAGGSEVVDLDQYSDWVRDNLNVLEHPVVHTIEMAQETVQLSPPADTNTDAWVQRLDSAIWLQPDGHRRGVTVADITALRQTTVDIDLPARMTLEFSELNGASVSPSDSAEFQIPPSQMPQRLVLWWTDRTATDEGIPLPALSNLEGETARVVLFGTDQQIYLFDDAARTIPLTEMFEGTSSTEVEQEDASPIALALVAAGIDRRSIDPSRDAATTHAVQTTDRPAMLPVHLIDRYLARVLGLLVAATVLLVVWYVMGPWSQQLSQSLHLVSGLPGLVLLAAAIWWLGLSWLGLVLLVLLTSLWITELRRPAAQDASESRLQTTY